MKRNSALFAIWIAIGTIWAQSVTINRAAGWFESAFVEWQPVAGAESYNVYYTGGGATNQKIDNQLIRKYGNYLRADVLGLKPGNYTLKVAPVISGTEAAGNSTSSLIVVAHDRSGFAFSNNLVPGAYNADGSPKSGAAVIYVTENTKNTVSLNVAGASVNPCVGLQQILLGYAKGEEIRPLIIRLVGAITDPTELADGDIVIENGNKTHLGITLEGVGEDATVNGWGIRIKNATNVEVRNLGIMNVNSGEGDNIGLQQGNEHIWVHNNDFFYGDAGSDADQIKGDGALDCKKSTYVTFSYNHFWDNGKVNLLGLSENTTTGLYITFHHNWYDHSDSRHPRVRYYSAHVYNNYYDGNSKYGVGSTLGSSVYVEANYFRHCKRPMMISKQGTDVWNTTTLQNDYSKTQITFSGENGGIIKAYNNYMIEQARFVAYGDASFPNSTVDFDAYVATSRTATVPSTVKAAFGASTYNNFDNNSSIMYTYSADSAAQARTKVMAYAGRMAGGDFKWTFVNSTDDEGYLVITGLKNALVAYKTSLVSIQGDGQGNGGSIPVTSSSSTSIPSSSSVSVGGISSSGNVIASDFTHNFTVSGTSSNFYTITGTLSTSKGTVNYSGMNLTQCLKMETATEVRFTLAKEATLVMVFNSDFTGTVKINGANHNVTSGIIQVTLAAGDYAITKGDSSNLFYLSVTYNDSNNKSSSSSQSTTPIAAKIESTHSLFFDAKNNLLHVLPGIENANVRVYNLHGRLVFHRQQVSGFVALTGLKPGIYIVKAHAGQGLASCKIRVH